MGHDKEQASQEMTEAIISAAEHVNRAGSPELQAVMRVVLHILAGEIAERAGQVRKDARRSA